MAPKPADTDVVGASAEEVPDLVVEPRAAPTTSGRAARAGAAVAASMPSTGEAFELDFGSAGDGSLATGPASPAAAPLFGGPMLGSEFELFDEGSSSAAAELDFGFDLEPIAAAAPVSAAPVVAPASRAQRSDAPWPVGTTPHPDDLAVDLGAVRQLAAFGDAPGFFGSPVYALRVALRRRTLRAREREAAAELRRVENAREDVLVEVAKACRAPLEANDRYGSLAREFSAHERLIGEHVAALDEADAGLHAVATEIDTQLEAVERERSVALEELTSRQREVTEREAELGRVAARAKRLDIERRALLDVARRKLGPQGGELPPEVVGPLGEIDARAAALAPELAELQRRVSEGKARQADAQRELELIDAKGKRLTAQKTMQLTERQSERERRARALAEARGAERTALVAVAQAVLAMKGHVTVDEKSLTDLRELDARVTQAAYEVEEVRLALRAFDGSAVQNGYVFTALLLLVAVGAAVLL